LTRSCRHVTRGACQTANLNQQFVYDLLTKQIRPVSRLGKWAGEVYDEEDDVSFDFMDTQLVACDNANPEQKGAARPQAAHGRQLNMRQDP
jgi:hypothetical protein